MGFLSRLLGWDRDRRDRHAHDAARKLSPAMPMAAAGAEVSAESKTSETEDNLRKAADR